MRMIIVAISVTISVAVLGACRPPLPVDATSMIRSGRHVELRDRLQAERPADSAAAARRAIVLARVLVDLWVNWNAARFEDALAALEGVESVDPKLQAELEQVHGEVVFWRKLVDNHGEWDDVRPWFERAHRRRTTLADARGIAESLFYRGLVEQFTGTAATARAMFERALELASTVDDPLLRSYPIRHLGSLSEDAGELDRALSQYLESLALREQVGDKIRLFHARMAVASLLCERMHDCARARPYLEQAKQIAVALKLPNGLKEVATLEAKVAAQR